MLDIRAKKIIVTGGAGFLGSAVVKKLREDCGVPPQNIFVPRSREYDLRRSEDRRKMFDNFLPDIVIHLAADVGGIRYNAEHPGSIFFNNAMQSIGLIEEARERRAEKFLICGSACSYPREAPQPFKEESLWNGYPEETSAPYGFSKLVALVQAQAYRRQYGFNGVYVIPTNLYGPGDNFDPASSHVIPALIRKIYDAKKRDDKKISVWGTGDASREFLYVEDAAEGIIAALLNYDKPEPVNLGTGNEITIKELVTLLCRLIGYKGSIEWDSAKPEGQPKRYLDVSRARKEFGFVAKTPLEEGLRKTIGWYAGQELVSS